MARPVPAAVLNAAVAAGMARAEELEPRLAAIVLPILNGAGDRAATRFTEYATNLLTADGRPTTTPGVGAGSAMVALYPRPEEAARLAEEGAEPPEVLHVTVCYLGSEVTAEQAESAAEALLRVAASHPPLAGEVGGVACFGDNGDGHPAIVLPDVRGLAELRHAVCTALTEAGIDYARNHGYTPHLTIGYRNGAGPVPPDAALIGEPLHFDRLHVVLGNQDAAVHRLTGGLLPVTAAADPFMDALVDAMTESIEDTAVPSPYIGFRPPRAVHALDCDLDHDCTCDAGLAAAGLPDWTPPAANELVDVDALVSKLRGKTDPVRLASVRDTMTPALKAAGLSFDVTNPLTGRAMAETGKHITNIAETTRLNVMRIVSRSHEEGLSIPATAKAIRAGMREADVARATLIARTELVGAVNGGSLAATEIVASATGVNYWKEWLVSPGAKHPRHELYPELDKQTRALTDTFQVGAAAMQHPGDPAGPPGEVCNCRCTMTYTEHPPEGGGQVVKLPGAEAEAEITTEAAVDYYSTPKAFDLNDALREGRDLTPEQQAVTRALDRGFEPAPKGGLTLYRGLPDSKAVFGKAKPTAKQRVELDGYTSATTEQSVAHDFASGIAAPTDRPVMVRIVVPEGTPVLRVTSEYEYAGEEYLLPRGVALRVESVEGRMVKGADIADTPIVNTSILSRPTVETLHREAAAAEDALAPRPVKKGKWSDDPYVASLQKEKASAGNKIANLVWKEKHDGELYQGREVRFTQDDRARLRALREYEARTTNAIDEGWDIGFERTVLEEEISTLGSYVEAEAGEAAHYGKLIEARLKQLDTVGPPPVAEFTDDLRALIDTNAQETLANYYGGILNSPLGSVTAAKEYARDIARWKLGLGPEPYPPAALPPPVASWIKGSAEVTVKSWQDAAATAARAAERQAAAETAVPGTLAYDIARIRREADWVDQREAGRRVLDSGVDAKVAARFSSAGGHTPVYIREQMQAILKAGERMEQEITTLAQKQAGAVAPVLDHEAELGRLMAAKIDLLETLRAYSDKLRDTIALDRYNATYAEALTLPEARAIRTEITRAVSTDPRYRSLNADLQAIEDKVGDLRRTQTRSYERGYGSYRNTRSAEVEASRKATVEALGQIRPMGPDAKVRLQHGNFDEGVRKGEPSERVEEARGLLDQATQFFPRSWIEQMRTVDAGMNERGYHGNRGSWQAIRISERRGAVRSDPNGFPTAIHELGHEVEDVVPIVSQAERAFYEWRTRGRSWTAAQEDQQTLRSLTGNSAYREDEFARPDEFSDPYMGKEYGSRSFELLTMGLEAVFTGSEKLDVEYRRFILGLLALL